MKANDYEQKLYQLAMNSNSSKNFNQIMKEYQELQKQEQLKNKPERISNKIQDLIMKICQQSNSSQQTNQIMLLVKNLGNLLEDVDTLKEQIKDQDSITLYQKYRDLIMNLNEDEKMCEKISQESLQVISDEKLLQIKKRLYLLFEKAKQLHTATMKKTQKYLLWMDKNASNNKEILTLIQQQYKGFVLVQYYEDNQDFRNDVLIYKENPCVIIMSAVAAGSNVQYGDGDHFNFLKQNKHQLRIQGCILYCGQQGALNNQHLLMDPSKLLKKITTEEAKLQQYVEEMLIPSEYKRVIQLEHIDFFIPNIKQEALQIQFQNYTFQSLQAINPNKKSLRNAFKKAKELIILKKISLKQDVIDGIENIPELLENAFQNQSDQIVVDRIIQIYSEQSNKYPTYQFLNSTLNILNEELTFTLLQFYYIFIISLHLYNDINDTIIQPNGSVLTLFRGSSIDKDHFSDIIQKSKTILLPSFSSFSTLKHKAEQFILANCFEDTVPVLFEYKYKTGSDYFKNRPKNIRRVSKFPCEDEYIIYPFTQFIIKEVKQPTQQTPYYTIVI
ncbi:hypothetical protein TTHERM_00894410 (macronuclear) [Tetrahymena thermophila SB210]|uniref:Uncharacterized protein n=1 Tax=Tetrahymena thermophila (strain SB210) TaxID=312017 RepID=Q23U53_TETTS|nr:hypothetical protein TTHERM_00894410 [Tetrahymena thermophila SB210]EAS00091.1 hypothetical protein TTHERM_00894410 [Tetrahymena thermophila SB210]|eukprot:XP_001020336.1 hypothetical protein TTHERM_00894410 [Tetrahymena thermophila SB210]